ncbi:hypothetical protein MMC17_004671 [Xylographa soralifera]|nr:hypothetical protein [Xylographa soralifera]
MCVQKLDRMMCKREEVEEIPRLWHIRFKHFVPCKDAPKNGVFACSGDKVTYEEDQLSIVVQKTDVEQNKCPVCNKLPSAVLAPEEIKGNSIPNAWIHYLWTKQRNYFSINRNRESAIGDAMDEEARDGVADDEEAEGGKRKLLTRPVDWFSIFQDVRKRVLYKVNPNFKIVNVLAEVNSDKKHVYEFEEIEDVKFLRFVKDGEELVDEEDKKK